MPAAYLFYSPKFRPLTPAGAIMPGAYVQFYETGTTTPADVYSDAALTTPLSNPVVADAAGEFVPIYLDPSVTYRAILFDADDVQQWDIDPLAPPRDYPIGSVVMFHGLAAARDAAYPPSLWQVCDGTNGTPDLVDRMPVGAGATYQSGDTGGAAAGMTGAAGAHDHGGAAGGHTLTTGELPAHQHGMKMAVGGTPVLYSSGSARGMGAFSGAPSAYVDDFGGENDVVQSIGGGGSHNHSISAAADHQHSLAGLPPYCGIWFLMRIA